MDERSDLADWVEEQLSAAEFGDARRWARAASMLRRAAQAPAGRLSEVFRHPAELQAAYDFVEGSVPVDALVDTFAHASLRAVQHDEFVYVPIDGSTLTLTDRRQSADFGPIGARAIAARGLKLLDAIAVDQRGTPVGLLDLIGWSRGPKSNRPDYLRRRAKETETHRWVDVVERISQRAQQAERGCRLWFVVDREGDSTELLGALAGSGHWFTVRSNQDRRVYLPEGVHDRLRSVLRWRRVRGVRAVDVPPRRKRTGRVAKLDVRFGRVVLALPSRDGDRRTALPVYAVWARERRAPQGEAPLDWLLLTNRPVEALTDAFAVLDSYCQRWRIEDFHRCWKRGRCNVEDSQLRARDHVLRWAAMLAAVAMRVERLKYLARTTPDAPASIELTPIEIEALRATIQLIKKRTESVPDELTISQAVFWLGRNGGFSGKGLPGSTTLGRGLEHFLMWASGFAFARQLARK